MTSTHLSPMMYARPRRAVRYAIEAPACLRVGRGEWLAGTTVNIAHLGVLLRTSASVPPVSARVDVRLMLCSGEQARVCSVVSCSGRVVRVEGQDADGATAVAVTIDTYEMRPAPTGPSRPDTEPNGRWWLSPGLFSGPEPSFA